MMNYYWWRKMVDRVYLPQVRYLVEVLENRLMPTLENIEKEAEEKENKDYDALRSMPSSGDDSIDMADLAEIAHDKALAYYEMMIGVRQGLLNVLAVHLYHLFEQQVLEFHRKEVLTIFEEKNKKLMDIKIFLERLKKKGINISSFSCWPMINELRLAANTVKHAEGGSAEKLHMVRPRLFRSPFVPEELSKKTNFKPNVSLPLAGEDLYVSLSDIRRYRDAVEKFWEELLSATYPKDAG